MNEDTSYIIRRPSQLMNLGILLRVLILIPVLYFLYGLLRESLAAHWLSADFARLMLFIPGILAAIAGLSLLYQVLRVRSTRYEITPEELKYYSGILSREHEYIELYRVKDFKIERPFMYRMFGLGTLIIYTSDKTTPEFRMEAIRKPEETYTILRAFVERNRRLKRVYEVD